MVNKVKGFPVAAAVLCMIVCVYFCAVCCDKSSRLFVDDMTLQEQLDNGMLKRYELIGGEDILKNVIDMDCPNAETPNDPIYLITKDGDLYQLSVNKIFSNGTNFKKIDLDKKLVCFFRSGVVDDAGMLYSFWGEPISLADYVQELEFCGNDITKLMYFNSFSVNSKPIAAVENKLYDCTTGEIVYAFEENIRIEYVRSNNTIKTNDGWYVLVYECTNQNEVDTYADVKPEYQFRCVKVQLDQETTYYNDLHRTGGKDGTIIQNGVLYGVVLA